MKNKNPNFFSNILIKYINNSSSKSEKNIVDDLFNSLKKDLIWDDSKLGNKVFLKDRLKHSILRETKTTKRHSNRFVYFAAAACITILFGVFNLTHSTPPPKVFATNKTIDSILLKDGSKIILGPNSSIEYPESFANTHRTVSLKKGNAYFKVARDTSKPFTVQHDKLNTQVLGTSFNINSTSDDICVYVITGKVSVKSHRNQSITLLPTESADFNFQSKALIKKAQVNHLPWYNKELNLKQVSLGKLSYIINNRFGYKLNFNNSELKHDLVTVTISAQDTVESLMNQLSYITNLKTKINANDIDIQK
ncbi:FecR family protein [Algibacter sp. Ld11]|uniref:FecR family protein n=1 Tax=Algibacter sp. Ld11 TaxID=649150 RepID=UPI00386FDD5C